MRILVITTALTLGLASLALAGPKDKTSETLVDPNGVDGTANVWSNSTVKAIVKTGGCKLKIQVKGAGSGIEGQEVICLTEADVVIDVIFPPPGAGNSLVTQDTVSDGKLKIKANLAAVGCGLLNALALNASTTCYQEDPNYDPEVACGAAGMGWLAPGDLGGDFKEDSLRGLCQGASFDDRIDPPASPVLAVRGALQPTE
jgi:hypothetical protein